MQRKDCLKYATVKDKKLHVMWIDQSDIAFKRLDPQSPFRSSKSGDRFTILGKFGTIVGVKVAMEVHSRHTPDVHFDVRPDDHSEDCMLAMEGKDTLCTEDSLSTKEKENIFLLDDNGKIITANK
jgi:hypothetical protein